MEYEIQRFVSSKVLFEMTSGKKYVHYHQSIPRYVFGSSDPELSSPIQVPFKAQPNPRIFKPTDI